MIKKILSSLLCFCCLYAAAQESDPVQEAMGNYDYETALTLIDQEETLTLPLLYQKGKALKGLGNNAEATSNYDAAVSMLYTIRSKRKQDDFFQGKVDTASVIPIR